MALIPKDWPFKGKPTTNGYIQFTIYLTMYVLWLVAIFMWAAPTFLATLAALLFMLVRAIYRSIAPEWRKPDAS